MIQDRDEINLGVGQGVVIREFSWRQGTGTLTNAAIWPDVPAAASADQQSSLEGTAISISKDDGKTWSDMDILFYAGRHHANLQRMPNGDLVCTTNVRTDCDDTEHKLASYRRGCDAVHARLAGSRDCAWEP